MQALMWLNIIIKGWWQVEWFAVPLAEKYQIPDLILSCTEAAAVALNIFLGVRGAV